MRPLRHSTSVKLNRGINSSKNKIAEAIWPKADCAAFYPTISYVHKTIFYLKGMNSLTGNSAIRPKKEKKITLET